MLLCTLCIINQCTIIYYVNGFISLKGQYVGLKLYYFTGLLASKVFLDICGKTTIIPAAIINIVCLKFRRNMYRLVITSLSIQSCGLHLELCRKPILGIAAKAVNVCTKLDAVESLIC